MGGLHCNVCASCHCVLQGARLCCCCVAAQAANGAAMPHNTSAATVPCRSRHSYLATVQGVCAVRLHGVITRQGQAQLLPSSRPLGPQEVHRSACGAAAEIACCSFPCRTAYLWEGMVEAEVAAMRFVHNQGHLPAMADLSYACSRSMCGCWPSRRGR